MLISALAPAAERDASSSEVMGAKHHLFCASKHLHKVSNVNVVGGRRLKSQKHHSLQFKHKPTDED